MKLFYNSTQHKAGFGNKLTLFPMGGGGGHLFILSPKNITFTPKMIYYLLLYIIEIVLNMRKLCHIYLSQFVFEDISLSWLFRSQQNM